MAVIIEDGYVYHILRSIIIEGRNERGTQKHRRYPKRKISALSLVGRWTTGIFGSAHARSFPSAAAFPDLIFLAISLASPSPLPYLNNSPYVLPPAYVSLLDRFSLSRYLQQSVPSVTNLLPELFLSERDPHTKWLPTR